MTSAVALVLSAGLIALSAFFVAVEFAMVAARRHRLADAEGTSRAARAALRGKRELSLVLAGAQLGITLCTVALGAVAKPAVYELLRPPLAAAGLGETAAGVLAFLLALSVVTFLHLVVGEMAPKSWAISHPERSATWLAPPMSAFLRLTRPMLAALNGLADRCLRRLGIDPVGETDGGVDQEGLRALLVHSTRDGTLQRGHGDRLGALLELPSRPIAALARARHEIAEVSCAASAAHIRAHAADTGHLRLVVIDRGEPVGVVHARDALTCPAEATAGTLLRPAPRLPASTPIPAAITAMREQHNQLALVYRGDELTGLVTLEDLIDQLPLGGDR